MALFSWKWVFSRSCDNQSMALNDSRFGMALFMGLQGKVFTMEALRVLTLFLSLWLFYIFRILLYSLKNNTKEENKHFTHLEHHKTFACWHCVFTDKDIEAVYFRPPWTECYGKGNSILWVYIDYNIIYRAI